MLVVAGDDRSLILKKVEPWNSVRVTFNIPADAADRLRELAQHPNSVLRELGVLAVQIGGDRVMSLSVAGNGSNTDTKPTDVVAGSGSQSICQPTASAVFSSSGKTSSQPTDQSFQQFKVPTLVVPSCCPSVLPPASGAVRTITVDHPVPHIASSLSVARPGSVGLVRWPNVVPGRPGLDAVAVRFAVPPVPVKEFSQGLCFISPLRTAVSHQNIASSSPLLVNLLQTRRQQSITAIPSQPVIPLDTSALILPQKRRRNTSARKAKQPRNEQEVVMPVTSLQLATDSRISHVTQTRDLPITSTFAAGSMTTATCDNQMLTESENNADESLTEDTGRARRMINPYTGNLELVDITEDDGLSVPVYSSAEISGSYSTCPQIETAVTKNTTLLNNHQCMTVSGLSSQTLPNFMQSVEASESGNLLAKNEDIPCTENPTISPSFSVSTVPTSSRYVDWYTASQSDKHNRLQCDTARLLFASSLSGVKQPALVESVQVSNITMPSENLSNDTRAETCSSDERCVSTVKPFCSSYRPSAGSLSKTSSVTVSCLESVRQKSMSDGIPAQSSNLGTSCSTVPQLSTPQTDLIQMALTLAKQNGSALHVSSLVDNWTKNVGLLQSSLQSLHGLHNIKLTTTGIPFHSLSTATTPSSCAQSRLKDADGLTSTTTVVSSDTCFFPAVSCFPPEHRRKSAVSIGGLGIKQEPQSQTGTSGAMSSLGSTFPAVKILSSTSMPVEAKTCGISVVPSTASSSVTVNTSINTDSNLLSAGIDQAPLPNTDMKKSIPLLTHLAPTSWPLMPNLLTVPLGNATPLSGSPLLHCVTRSPLTPDGKLAGLSAAVSNTKGGIVPLAGRFCIPLSSSQATSVTAGADKQHMEYTTDVSGMRPHTIMLNDNLTKFKLSVSSNTSKSSGKHGSSKDRRGCMTRTDESIVQRGSGKSHLTVAQLLDMAKNARLQQTACDDEQARSSKQQNEPSSSAVTLASLQPQSALTISPLQLSSLPLQSSSVLSASHDQSQAQLVSIRLSSSAPGSIHTAPISSSLLLTNANSVLSFSATSSAVVSHSSTTTVTSTLTSHLLAQPLSTVSTHSAAGSVDVLGNTSVESAISSEYLALNTFSSSVSASLPMSAYSVHPPLPITSPRYPLNLTESVKKAMRGVGLYPSPPLSPTTPLQTYGSSKLPEIRPYPGTIAFSVPVSELSSKKLIQDRSTFTVPVMSQQQLLSASNSATVSRVNSCGLLAASVNATSRQVLTTANNCTSSVSPTTVCAEVTEKQLCIKNGDIISHSDSADVRVVPAVMSVGLTTAADCILTYDALSLVSQSGAIRPELVTTECSAYVNTTTGSAVVTCTVPKSELLSSVVVENNSFQGHAVSSHSSSKNGLHVTKTVHFLNGRLSASSGDSDVELHHDILEGLSSVETDAGLSSLQSSPCSADLANVLDSAKETSTALANDSEVMNCITAVDHRQSHDAVPSSARLFLDSPLCERSLSLHSDTTVEDGYIKAVSLASDVSGASVVVPGNQEVTADCVDLPFQKAAADSSVMSSKYTLLKRNRLQTALSNIGIRSAARRKRSADMDRNSDDVKSDTLNSVEPAGEQQAVPVTRMTTRRSQRTAASTTELANKVVSNETKSEIEKTPMKLSEKRGRTTSESSNHVPDPTSTKLDVVTQRRSMRTPVAKVLELKKPKMETACHNTDSGIGLRSRRHAQKMNSVEVVTPRKRAGLRGTGVGKEVLCLIDSSENVIGILDGSDGTDINVNDHEDNR